ncbi:hypothetical protein [Cellulomonas hominis]
MPLAFSVAALRGSDLAARTASRYAFARSLALAVVAVVALFTGSTPFVVAIAITMVVVQTADAVIGAAVRDRLTTLGPAVTSAVNLGALAWLLLG